MSAFYNDRPLYSKVWKRRRTGITGTDSVRACINNNKENYSIDISFYSRANQIEESKQPMLEKALIEIELPKGQVWSGTIDDLQHLLLPHHKSTEFIHPEIQHGLQSLDDQQTYNYKIEQTTTEPENFQLYIWEADANQTYNYESKEDAENDVRMAAKHYNLELIDFSALPSAG